MKRVSHETWASIIHMIFLALSVNILVLIGCLPFVVLLVTTNPAYSWPMLAVVAPLCAPAFAAAFTVFRQHGEGETRVWRGFGQAWKALARKALVIGVATTLVVTVLLVDIRMLSDTSFSVALVPALIVLTLMTLATAMVALVALAEVPSASLRDVFRSALILAVRRWYLVVVTLIVIAVQAVLFTALPAIALGLAAAPVLYVVWANSRYILRPALQLDESVA